MAMTVAGAGEAERIDDFVIRRLRGSRAGFDVVAWEEAEVRGQTFRRARMRKALR